MIGLFWRLFRRLPLVGTIGKNVAHYRQKAEEGVNKGVENVRLLSFRGGLVGLLTAMIIWVSIFLYVAFYYAYMPSISHVRPIHVQFEYVSSYGSESVLICNSFDSPEMFYVGSRACSEGKGLCSFPTADVRLTKRHQLLMVGQPYKIYVQLEMPESPVNKDLGMTHY